MFRLLRKEVYPFISLKNKKRLGWKIKKKKIYFRFYHAHKKCHKNVKFNKRNRNYDHPRINIAYIFCVKGIIALHVEKSLTWNTDKFSETLHMAISSISGFYKF